MIVLFLIFVNIMSSNISNDSLIVNGTNEKPIFQTGVLFNTSDVALQKVFDEAEKKAKLNIKQLGKYKVLVEGGGYYNAWLETQPIGGGMYAKRNVEVAINNQLIFMDNQRTDGRLPGCIGIEDGNIEPRYRVLQGNYLPLEAFDVYYWTGKDETFLTKLYHTLDGYDKYLWDTRDSDKDGCLEIWCTGDTGEDNSTRFGNSFHYWSFSFAPTKENLSNLSKEDSIELINLNNASWMSHKYTIETIRNTTPMPIESMDMMSYSYANRIILAKISKILSNGKEEYWKNKANEIQQKLKELLWIPDKHACYDKDKDNKVIDILIHNNLRCMYFGSFDQKMADEFIKYHLMNHNEFWTPMPLPSIAVNNLAFRNILGNNWSGQPHGLTFQRSIRALENYGHYAELTLIGKSFLHTLSNSLKFTQQFDPFTCAIDNKALDGFGPSILSSLEFISRMYGIHITQHKIYWSCLDNKNEYNYSQKWGSKLFEMKTKGNQVFCYINGEEIFIFTKGIRVVSDIQGNILEVIGIERWKTQVQIISKKKIFNLSVNPNDIFSFSDNFYKTKNIEFSDPDIK